MAWFLPATCKQTFEDSTTVKRPVTFFAGEGTNKWRMLGDYNIKRYGEITTRHLRLLPESVVNTWVNGVLTSTWGKQWVTKENAGIEENTKAGVKPTLITFTEEGLTDAFLDGRMVIGFTVMQCVGFSCEKHELLLEARAHPKPPKSKKRKLARKTGRTPRRKAAKGKGGKRVVSMRVESDEEEEDASDGDGSWAGDKEY